MVLLRGVSNVVLGDTFGGRLAANNGFDETVFSWSLWFMIIRYLLLCYSVLHIACGFELALDSFTVRFFNELDLEEALEEWKLWPIQRFSSFSIHWNSMLVGYVGTLGLRQAPKITAVRQSMTCLFVVNSGISSKRPSGKSLVSWVIAYWSLELAVWPVWSFWRYMCSSLRMLILTWWSISCHVSFLWSYSFFIASWGQLRSLKKPIV